MIIYIDLKVYVTAIGACLSVLYMGVRFVGVFMYVYIDGMAVYAISMWLPW